MRRSPGSEKSHCSEIGLQCALKWAQSCTENGPYLCSGWRTPASLLHRAILFHRSQNARRRENLADENSRENNPLHLAHETLVGPNTLLYIEIFTLKRILTAQPNYGAQLCIARTLNISNNFYLGIIWRQVKLDNVQLCETQI